MSKYFVEKEDDYINIYKDDTLYQQLRCFESPTTKEIVFAKVKKYYENKQVKEIGKEFRENIQPRLDEIIEERKSLNEAGSKVDHPSYYNTGNIEVIDFIDSAELNFNLGNAVKYIARAGKKDPSKTIEDLKKAEWYINHEIKKLWREQNEG